MISLTITQGILSLCLLVTVTQGASTIHEARCYMDPKVSPDWQKIGGTIRLRQVDDGPVVLSVRLEGFNRTDGQPMHGFHIHYLHGEINEQERCHNLGGHYNPTNSDHGGRTSEIRHIGDFGNVVEDNGEVNLMFYDRDISLYDLRDRYNIIGQAMDVHQFTDDLGLSNETGSKINGRAGPKMACCKIELAEPADFIEASCTMDVNETGSDPEQIITGSVSIKQLKTGGMTTYSVDLAGFSTTDGILQHGFHVHTTGDTGEMCQAAGGHYNPFNKFHGALDNTLSMRHVGDLGNVNETNGNVVTTIMDLGSGLTGEESIIGRSVVVHARRDDLGLLNTTASRTTGDAGARLGCCVIRDSLADLPAHGGASDVRHSCDVISLLASLSLSLYLLLRG